MPSDATPPKTLKQLLAYSRELRERADELSAESAKLAQHIQDVQKAAETLAAEKRKKRR